MRLNIVNPNTSAAITRIIVESAGRVARPGTAICAVESEFGPASIEGPCDDAFAVRGLLARIAEGERERADAHVIACFDGHRSRCRAHSPALRSSASARQRFMWQV